MRSRVSQITGLNLQAVFDPAELAAVRPGVLVVFDHDSHRIPDLRAAIPDVRICLRLFGDPANPGALAEQGYQLASRYLRDGDFLTPFNV